MSAMNVSRFANPRATRTYTFPGPCQCPGQPHEADTAVVIVRPSASALARIGAADITGTMRGDPLAANRQTILEGVSSWNLLMPDPAIDDADEAAAKPVPAPVTPTVVGLLDASLVPLSEWIDDLWNGPVPNSDAPSPESRRGSESRRQTKTQKPGT